MSGGIRWATLTPDQRDTYLTALRSPHAKASLQVHVLDLDHRHGGDLSKQTLLEGQTTLSRGADVDRTCQLTVYDADEVYDLDLRHLVRVEHGLVVPDLGDVVWVPVFTGRAMAPSDNGDTLQVELHGKETFALNPGAPARKWGKGTPVAKAIRDMLSDLGERFFDIPASLLTGAPKLAGDVQSGGPDEEKAPWRIARRIAGQADLQVFYDAMGVCVVRSPPQTPEAVWAESADPSLPGDESTTPLTSRIVWGRDLKEVRNVVSAKGRKNLHVSVTAAAEHVFSPSSLARGGVPGRLVHYWEDRSVGARAELTRRAQRILDQVLTETTNARFDAGPVFHVGPHDLIEAKRRDGKWGRWYLQEASIPFDPGNAMSVGYQPNVRDRRR